jgi:SAM-dependent methyltransferase
MTSPAQSFDVAAEAYDAGRPDYPPELLDFLPLEGVRSVLDLAAGTGKLTRVLAGRFLDVTAVEPLPAMRAILERNVPAARVLAGTAEDLPLGAAAVDAVFVGQAFHWFANERAVAEIARVLRAGGLVVLVWNREARGRSPLPPAFRARLRELSGQAAETDPETREALMRGPFEAPHQIELQHRFVSNREKELAYVASTSWVASLPPDERKRALDELAALLPRGDYSRTLRAEVTWAVRR